MSRMRITRDGPEIAREGHHVESAAPGDMFFSPFGGVAARVRETGVIAVAAFTAEFRWAHVDFATHFPHPPMMFFAGLMPDGGADVTPLLNIIIGNTYAVSMPHYHANISATGFDLYAWNGRPGIRLAPDDWRWWALENTMLE